LGIDIQDDMGRHEVGFVENTVKTPIGLDGQGCLFEARFHINKVLFVCHPSAIFSVLAKTDIEK
jgi:hypothetical protein